MLTVASPSVIPNGKLFADLDGHVVQQFNSDKPNELPSIVSNWLQQRVRIAPIYDGFAQMFPSSKIAIRIKEQPQEKLAIARFLVQRWIDRMEDNTLDTRHQGDHGWSQEPQTGCRPWRETGTRLNAACAGL